MNSISNMKSSKPDAFFIEVLVPLAKKLKSKNNAPFFQKSPDPHKDTYFVKREKVTMAPEDFETASCNTQEDLKRALINLWNAEGNTELLIMADEIAKLAESTHHQGEQCSEISPFIYVMF